MGKRFKRLAQGLILIITLGLSINVSFANAVPLQINNIYLPIIVKEYPLLLYYFQMVILNKVHLFGLNFPPMDMS